MLFERVDIEKKFVRVFPLSPITKRNIMQILTAELSQIVAKDKLTSPV